MNRQLILLLVIIFIVAGCAGQSHRANPITVEWTTETEVDTAGFNIYRSESPDGPFVKLNRQLIPASPDPIVGGSYVYTATDVVPGVTYYYELEDVEFDGDVQRHGPIQATAQAATSHWLASLLWGLAGASVVLAATLLWTRRSKRGPR